MERYPSPTLIHIDMREPARAGALYKKGWTTDLWHQLQLALPELRAVRLIPAPKTVDSLLGGHVAARGGEVEVGGLHRLPHHEPPPLSPPPPART